MNFLGGGGSLDTENPNATAQNYAKVVGYINGLQAIMNIEIEEELEENAESNR